MISYCIRAAPGLEPEQLREDKNNNIAHSLTTTPGSKNSPGLEEAPSVASRGGEGASHCYWGIDEGRRGREKAVRTYMETIASHTKLHQVL